MAQEARCTLGKHQISVGWRGGVSRAPAGAEAWRLAWVGVLFFGLSVFSGIDDGESVFWVSTWVLEYLSRRCQSRESVVGAVQNN